MEDIKREAYLNKLIDSKENSMIKVITGIRRCGKSYLLFNLYYDYLLSIGVKENQIIKIALDNRANKKFRDPDILETYLKEKLKNDNMNYIFLDEIQLVSDFEYVLNGINRFTNADIYVTGSNSKFLSTDIITEFRGRGYEIRINPLSFSEFSNAFTGKTEEMWNEYFRYGGLPMILSFKNDEQKSKYLTSLFEKVYLTDVIERNNLQKDNVLESIINILASSVGSLTNPLKISNSFISNGVKGVTDKTVSTYINYLTEAFMINKAERYDIKGKKYISTPSKYYFSDIGLRNARLNFRQQEENHIMENIIFNELLVRGLNVDVGIVDHWTTDLKGKRIKKQLEVDFVCNQGSKRYYIQSALAIPDTEKMQQEQNSLIRIDDSFKKIIIVKENIRLWRNDQGIVIMGIQEFLLKKDSLDL